MYRAAGAGIQQLMFWTLFLPVDPDSFFLLPLITFPSSQKTIDHFQVPKTLALKTRLLIKVRNPSSENEFYLHPFFFGSRSIFRAAKIKNPFNGNACYAELR